MKGGGRSTPSTTTQIQQVKLPEWVEKGSQENYEFAKQIASKPYVEYQGQTVAGPSQATVAAYNLMNNNIGLGQADIAKAAELFANSGKGITALDRSKYLNPYIDEVETKALSALDKQRTQALMANADAAQKAKAFGGSRHGVVDAITNAESAEKAGLLSADLRKQGFDTSSALMQQDIANMLSGGQGLLASSKAAGDQLNRDFMSLMTMGQQQQAQQQAQLDDAYGRWQERQNEDLNDLNIRLAALGMSPYGKTESTTGNSVTKSSPDWISAGLGAGILALGLFSDRDDKTDIEKLGKDPSTGLDLYAYRYKGDPKYYPKVVGPMAQDIKKKYPDAVKTVGGHNIIKGALAR